MLEYCERQNGTNSSYRTKRADSKTLNTVWAHFQKIGRIIVGHPKVGVLTNFGTGRNFSFDVIICVLDHAVIRLCGEIIRSAQISIDLWDGFNTGQSFIRNLVGTKS